MRGTECVTTHHRRAHRAAASRSRSTSSSSCARRPHLVRGRQDEGSGRACAARAEARWPGGEGLDVATRAIAQRRGAPARVARPLATSSRRRAAGGRRRARPLQVASVASCLEPSVESCQTHMGSSSATLARNIERRAPGERARAAWVWGGGAGRARTAAPPHPSQRTLAHVSHLTCARRRPACSGSRSRRSSTPWRCVHPRPGPRQRGGLSAHRSRKRICASMVGSTGRWRAQASWAAPRGRSPRPERLSCKSTPAYSSAPPPELGRRASTRWRRRCAWWQGAWSTSSS